MADLTRRAFIGRTLLTGATIASGGLSTISTSPTTPTVAKVATTFKNLNVLSPKAKAYRTFLRGIVGGAEMYQKHRPTGRLKTSVKTVLTKHSEHNPKTGNIEREKTSYVFSKVLDKFTTLCGSVKKLSTINVGHCMFYLFSFFLRFLFLFRFLFLLFLSRHNSLLPK